MDANDRFTTPPLEAYSRVTNPERFRPLHRLARDVLDELRDGYDVRADSRFDPLPDMTPIEHALPPVALTPLLPTASPVAVAFTAFPGLILRFGRWLAEPFPSCGCDACTETAEGEGERFRYLLGEVVAGRFREELSVPRFGRARLRWWLGESGDPAGRRSSGFRVLPRDHARALRRSGSGLVRWEPWTRRSGGGPARVTGSVGGLTG